MKTNSLKTEKVITRVTAYYYVLINKRGGLLLINGQLPIYWKKRVALEVAKNHGATVHPIYSLDLIDKISKFPITFKLLNQSK